MSVEASVDVIKEIEGHPLSTTDVAVAALLHRYFRTHDEGLMLTNGELPRAMLIARENLPNMKHGALEIIDFNEDGESEMVAASFRRLRDLQMIRSFGDTWWVPDKNFDRLGDLINSDWLDVVITDEEVNAMLAGLYDTTTIGD